MLRGYYSAASGMLAQQRRQEALSNNIANALTPGYKADEAVLRAFPEMLMQRLDSNTLPTERPLRFGTQKELGSINTGVYIQETIPDFIQGQLRQTGLTTDLALVDGIYPDETGSLFFTIQGLDGATRYTRNGNFTVDQEGFLVTNQGQYIVDTNNNRIQTGGMEFTVSPDGFIQIGENQIPLQLSYVSDVNQLVKEGNDQFRNEGGANVVDVRQTAGATYQIQQGFLEGSNVDQVRTMTEMMRTYRLFESNQKVLQAYDRSMEKAVNEIGRLR